MSPDIGTGDIVVGVLAAIGVVILLGVFVIVLRQVLRRPEE